MVWCGFTEFGPTPPYFLPRGETIDTNFYKNIILPFAKREVKKLFGTSQSIFQQDGARPHTSNASQQWCARN